MLSFLIWIGIPVCIIIIGIIFGSITQYEWPFTTALIFSFFLIVVFLFFIIKQIDTTSRIEEAQAIQETLDLQRSKNSFSSEMESIAVLSNVMEFNKQLAIDKYYNSIWIFDCFYNDNVMKVEFIK